MTQDDHTTDVRLSGKRRVGIAVLVLGLLVAGGVGWFVLTSAQTTDPYDVTEGARYNASDGPLVTLGEPLENTTVGQPFPNEHRVDLDSGAWVYSEGSTNVTLSGIGDAWVTAADLDVASNELTLSMPNAQETNVSGGAEYLEFRDVALDDGTDDLRIDASSTATVTLEDVPADTTIVAWDPASGDRLDYATSSSAGVVSLEFGATSGTTDVRLREANAPTINDGTADPTGDQSEYPTHFTADVDHEDFPGTTVGVEFFLDGQSVGTDTLTSAGEANVSAPNQIDGGMHQWHVVAEDDYGNVVNSTDGGTGFYTFNVPDELEIRDEENPSMLVDEANATLEFYFGSNQDNIVERDASGGAVDMTGLPTDQSFIVVANAEGYHPRRIYVESLFQSDVVYLLNESSEYVDVTFQLEDFTGDFPEEDTVLKVQRNIGGDWETVQGDFFGATGEWAGQLSYNTRHRLILLNTETGQERQVGSYTPVSSGVQTIRVLDSGTEIVEGGPRVSIDPSTRTLPATNTTVTVDLFANAAQIDQWSVEMVYENGSATTVLFDETMQGPDGGSVSPQLDLSGLDGGTVTVTTIVTQEDGTTQRQIVVYRVAEFYDHDNSFWAVMTDVPSVLGLGGGAMSFIAILITVMGTAGVARFGLVSTEGIGAVAVLFTAMFAIVGWLSWEIVVAVAITYAAMWGLWRGVR